MKFMHVNPILYSSDLPRSLAYYTEVLAFDKKWEWGEPPTFGGVAKDAVQLFFCECGQGNPGTWLSIFTTDVDEYFETIRTRGARIVSEPKTMEWGVREMLVEDPDGHRIRFGHGAKRVGTALMEALTAWLDRNAPENALVSLITGTGLAPFYNQFGFQPVFAMKRPVSSNSGVVGQSLSAQ